ncbi:hypothetical protein J7382_01440 [Shimia sp. R11_0]|uniref:hypothetical protein n=1 Tax=Shimia sp. R11_0 TaxID=2821096 RepID=UPI001ADB9CA1|nr:hypothetical protein [Shimia sp. R11_0]MBO9476186.1 hypothetical protein [Shimia sp. R11_0]
MFKRLVGTALLFGMAAAAPPAFANGCGPREIVVERLENHYSEGRSAAGLQGNSGNKVAILEIFSSDTTGTFTVILTNAEGMSCILAAGTDWFQHAPDLRPAGIDG